MYYALQRFELCKEKDFKKLIKDWKKYSKSENIDIYGKNIIEKDNNIEEHK
jgi:predicted SpoU family rRNA methylase